MSARVKDRTGDSGLLSFEESLELLFKAIDWRLPSERVATEDCLGRVLRQSLKAGFDVPPFDKSAMDGYAVRAADTAGAAEDAPVTLEVGEDIAAGSMGSKQVGRGRAARIMTGAPLPPGADAVVMVEYTERLGDGGRVSVLAEAKPGANIGFAGEDVSRGDLVLPEGQRLGPAEMGMVAALGKTAARVSRRPRLAVLSTGDEVAAPGEKRRKGQIYDSNGYALTGLAKSLGCDAAFLGSAKDRPDELKLLTASARDFDVVVMTGGVSVGDYDFVVDLLESLKIGRIFHKSFIKPGKPTFAGKKGKRLFFGLPGNPVSAMVCFHLYVRPALDLLSGARQVGMVCGRGIIDHDFKTKRGRRKFLRVGLAGDGPEIRVAVTGNQKSGVLRSMVGCDALMDVPGDVTEIPAGSEVDLLWL